MGVCLSIYKDKRLTDRQLRINDVCISVRIMQLNVDEERFNTLMELTNCNYQLLHFLNSVGHDLNDPHMDLFLLNNRNRIIYDNTYSN